ncbi:fused response regulator/phosphatase [Streptomyces canus]|uniref:Serine phosphatase RsbU (Regulator of sigma subunit)/DNA-binding response OmpR family regulator n=1 Tax=Streptomyces canus TaxID=58343 RepID=A0AAW8FM35_9ACTN|nr:fused response regulator/phosphatase [Streptomyces canus]MDQ0911191.1 serine phosphatase RsbU (regulator of sigma subunit)/DNA-binding response OmpR family regulator [Streptomyces canus]MDQ1071194.1 serine phosphatase RsbU (regulator of sigma subunit)/DNA-binding response OmpR family regulator [Streptomyces canus]
MDAKGKLTGTTVMVVDDVEASRYAMGTVLSRAGHRVVPVATGGEALAELDTRLRKGTLPDVALVDVGLPDMSGFELCRLFKERPHTAGMPVVHFSASAVPPAVHCAGMDMGVEAYLKVPAEPLEIEAVVRAAVRNAQLRAGDRALVRRLTLLSETIVTIQAARTLQELSDAAAEGLSQLTGTPGAVFLLDQDDVLYRGLSRDRIPVALPDEDADRAVAALLRRLARGQAGVQLTTVPAPLWPAGFFRPGVEHDARLALVVTQDGRAPVCLAAPARGMRRVGLEGETLLAQLAQATALAAQPLLMYKVERHVALTLQHSFLPQPHRLPELPGLDVVVRYVPASRQTEIGGDFYAALRVDEGVLTAVGDVVGHSLDAATVMVELRHALRAYAVDESDPAVLAERLDRTLQRYHPDTTATVCLALIDPDTGRTRIANAGHIPPLIVRDTGTADYAKAAGPLLGVGLPHPPATELFLEPTDRLLMVTDGLIETRGTDLTASLEHLRAAASGALPGLDALCDTLLDTFGHDREDDIAMLALRLG